MLINSVIKKIILQFNKPAGTSRGILNKKTSYIIKKVFANGNTGLGEASLIHGLSFDAKSDFELMLKNITDQIDQKIEPKGFKKWPAIRFAFEMALLDAQSYQSCLLYPSSFTQNKSSIPINGLIWMNTYDNMKQQIEAKIKEGFRCIKLKIGAINFEDELNLLKKIRLHYDAQDMMIRVDANGAFKAGDEAKFKLDALSKLAIHSIEQPIRAGQLEEMAKLCATTTLPIALDEELIGIFDLPKKKQLLEQIKPQHIILKPSFLGGFKASEEWINIANNLNIGWWVTSALESNIGLNAIAQWTATLDTQTFQGLGTGALFSNNFDSPLYIENGNLHHSTSKTWNFNGLI